MFARNQQHQKKPRKSNYLPSIEHRYYIFCEGEKTEPLYFRGFEKAIKSEPLYKNMIHIEVQGVGAETLRVLEAAEAYIAKNNINNGQVWCVYDKDSFPAKDFNAVTERIATLNLSTEKSSLKYYGAWSNQCIEYWFLLHFDFYDTDNDRKYYREFLHNKFKELGKYHYEKNNAELFRFLTEHGNPKQAVKYANKRLKDCKGLTDSASVPATKVHLLVKELAQYLPEDLRSKYIN